MPRRAMRFAGEPSQPSTRRPAHGPALPLGGASARQAAFGKSLPPYLGHLNVYEDSRAVWTDDTKWLAYMLHVC